MKEKETNITVFCCANSYEQTQMEHDIHPAGVKIKYISLPCSGKLDILYVVKAFETGADGVAVMMCPEGECRYLEGNMRARKRAEAVEELLEETGLSKGRVEVIQKESSGLGGEMKKLETFCGKISAMGGVTQVTAR
jgi:F420-non-reducing hydrogenase iron-sulfur subunit